LKGDQLENTSVFDEEFEELLMKWKKLKTQI
jgi:hypothetical protein